MARPIQAGIVSVAVMLALTNAPAQAQTPRELEIRGFHDLCNAGDRKACVRFGMLIQQSRDRLAEWRTRHPEWFWWER